MPHESVALDKRPTAWATSIAAVSATAAGTVDEIRQTAVSFKRVVVPIVILGLVDEDGAGVMEG